MVEVPRTFGPLALLSSTCALAMVGQPWLAAGLVVEVGVVATLGRWLAPVHHRWLDRWLWMVSGVALLVALALARASVDSTWRATWVGLLVALDLGLALLLAGWFDATGLAARAALEPDPGVGRRLRLRLLALGAEVASPSDPSARLAPVPSDEAALVARLDALAAWSSGAFHPVARPGRAAALRELLARGAGAMLLLVPVVGGLLFVGLPLEDAYLGVHAVAGAALTWGVLAVGLEHLVQRVDGPARAAVSWALLVGTLLVLVVIGLHIDTQLQFGVELDPGMGTTTALSRLERLLTRPRSLSIALGLAFGVAAPAALWGALARLDSTVEKPLLGGPLRVRRTTSTLGGTPWFLATALTFVLDAVVVTVAMRVLTSASGGLFLLLIGLPILGLHAGVVALAFGGLRLADRQRRAGVRRTVEDERRRVLAALVRLRFAAGADSR